MLRPLPHYEISPDSHLSCFVLMSVSVVNYCQLIFAPETNWLIIFLCTCAKLAGASVATVLVPPWSRNSLISIKRCPRKCLTSMNVTKSIWSSAGDCLFMGRSSMHCIWTIVKQVFLRGYFVKSIVLFFRGRTFENLGRFVSVWSDFPTSLTCESLWSFAHVVRREHETQITQQEHVFYPTVKITRLYRPYVNMAAVN